MYIYLLFLLKLKLKIKIGRKTLLKSLTVINYKGGYKRLITEKEFDKPFYITETNFETFKIAFNAYQNKNSIKPFAYLIYKNAQKLMFPIFLKILLLV